MSQVTMVPAAAPIPAAAHAHPHHHPGMATAAPLINLNTLLSNGKDSTWLQLEVCREFQRNRCTRGDNECKYAHPPGHVEVQNGRVIACYDNIKDRCSRDNPPCKYFHAPQHLKDQLLANGKNHLAIKNAILQQMGLQQHQPQQITMPTTLAATNPYISAGYTAQIGSAYAPYMTTAGHHLVQIGGAPVQDGSGLMTMAAMNATNSTVSNGGPKSPRADRIEAYQTLASNPGSGGGYKRVASGDKVSPGGNGPAPTAIPVYHQAPPSATGYQQLITLQQPFVPVSCEYSAPSTFTSTHAQSQISSSSPAPATDGGSGGGAGNANAASSNSIPASSISSAELPTDCVVSSSICSSATPSVIPSAAAALYTGVALSKMAPASSLRAAATSVSDAARAAAALAAALQQSQPPLSYPPSPYHSALSRQLYQPPVPTAAAQTPPYYYGALQGLGTAQAAQQTFGTPGAGTALQPNILGSFFAQQQAAVVAQAAHAQQIAAVAAQNQAVQAQQAYQQAILAEALKRQLGSTGGMISGGPPAKRVRRD